MIYEMRTETLRPGAVPEYEQRFEEKLASREKHSKLGAFWHTVIGPLNQVIHVWPYEDLAHRARVRTEAAQEPGWPPQVDDLTLNVQVEVMSPAPFMKPLGNRQLGNIYEMRIYSYIPGGIPHVVQRWSESIEYREQYSPLVAAWYPEMGRLNKWYHLWAYKDLEEREYLRGQSLRDPHWPVLTYEWLLRNECKIMEPAAFSPMH